MSSTLESSSRSSRARRLRSGIVAAVVALVAVASLAVGPVGSVAIQHGYRDFVYNALVDSAPAPGGDDVSAPRWQSKLWFNDGHWWALMFDKVSTANAKFRIFRFDMTTQAWMNTGLAVDDRNRSHGDALWDGTKNPDGTNNLGGTNNLYVASSHILSGVRVYKYSYTPATKVYALVSGYPKTITTAGTGPATIAKDAAGKLWVVYTQATDALVGTTTGNVMVSSSADGGDTWSAPFVLPAQGNPITAPRTVSPDAVAVTTLNNDAIGVLWSNQSATDDAFYFAAHLNGAAAGTWQARETAFGDGSSNHDADGHISVKTDPTGRVVAAVKTGRNDDPAKNGADPLIAVLRRSGASNAAGTWLVRNVSNVTQDATRPLLVLDAETGQANVFMTVASKSGGVPSACLSDPLVLECHVTVRTAPLDTLDFGATPSVGTVVIQDGAGAKVNDVTSSKQTAAVASGMLALAEDVGTRTYYHACAGSVCPVVPVAAFSAGATTLYKAQNVTFTDASTHAPTSWAWSFGDGLTSTLQNPVHAYANPGTYSVTLTATNAAGSNALTKTGYITVRPAPVASFTASPTSVYKAQNVSFTDASTNVPTSWAWAFGDGLTSTLRNPVHAYASPGTYSVTLTATSPSGSGALTRTNYITVRPAPIANFTASPTSGQAPRSVAFTDTSTNGPTSWAWSFGDGLSSTAQNPNHTYTTPGSYTVSLTATNPSGSNVKTQANLISISADPATVTPVANFTASPSPATGNAPLDVAFTDASTVGTPMSWHWTFGDGTSSFGQNPHHTYLAPGFFTVSLTAGNAGGTSTKTVAAFVHALDASPPTVVGPLARFPGSTVTGSTVVTRISWSGSDPSGVARYRLQQSTNGGAWVNVRLRSALSTSVNRSLTFGRRYAFRVYAVDRLGHASWTVGPTFKPWRFQERNAALRYSRGWHLTANRNASGGALKYATGRGSSVTLTTSARAISWVSTKARNRGVAYVYVDGSAVPVKVDLRSSSILYRRVVFSRAWSTLTTHTVRIVVAGTSGRPRVDVDAFLIAR